MDLACAEMMSHYRLPHCGTSGSGMGWGPDIIAAGHQWLNHLISCVGKVGLVPFVGDNLGSKAFSPTVVVYANEVIAQARLFAQGFALDESAVALEEVASVGPGGSFLMTDLTLKLFRRAAFQSEIFPTLTLEKWQEQGAPEAGRLLRQHTFRLLDGLEPPEDHEELMLEEKRLSVRALPSYPDPSAAQARDRGPDKRCTAAGQDTRCVACFLRWRGTGIQTLRWRRGLENQRPR